jgi:pyruvate ferredoxin oxidoreductase alpha subunit
LPIVMSVANRAIGAPINIWNDHSDAMALRDAGWIQLYASDNQEAVDLHIQAFRIAEELSVPVMVCVDGFILTHAFERLDLPEQAEVDRFLPAFSPRQQLDPDAPLTIGAMVGPEAFTEVRYLAHTNLCQALQVIPAVEAEFESQFGRQSGGLVHPYRIADARTVVVAQGSVAGTLQQVVDDLRADGLSVGALAITTYRPFPLEAVRLALAGADQVVVIDRALATGSGGFLASDVRPVVGAGVPCYDVVAGLGGRPVTQASLRRCLRDAAVGALEPMTFLDLHAEMMEEVGG